MLPLLTCQLHAQEVNDDEEDNTEETTKVSSLLKPKDGYRNIEEFHAYIYNRWGQKLYEWTDPAMGWDGTYRGKPVKEGVYFCLVKAKGADGVVYNIKRDVNLLRGYTEEQNSNY